MGKGNGISTEVFDAAYSKMEDTASKEARDLVSETAKDKLETALTTPVSLTSLADAPLLDKISHRPSIPSWVAVFHRSMTNVHLRYNISRYWERPLERYNRWCFACLLEIPRRTASPGSTFMQRLCQL